jgi:hypothetical protein
MNVRYEAKNRSRDSKRNKKFLRARRRESKEEM